LTRINFGRERLTTHATSMALAVITMLAPSGTPPSPPPGVAEVLLANARLLQRAEPGSDMEGLLRGKNLGLVCESDDDADATRFREAAEALGASVSHIRPELAPAGGVTGGSLLRTARLLGRLYDAIECQGLAPALVVQLGREAGVPVFDGVATPAHSIAQLALELNGPEPLEKKRRLLVQAVLLLELR
jgi:ornithine carbamoyltransferase